MNLQETARTAAVFTQIEIARLTERTQQTLAYLDKFFVLVGYRLGRLHILFFLPFRYELRMVARTELIPVLLDAV